MIFHSDSSDDIGQTHYDFPFSLLWCHWSHILWFSIQTALMTLVTHIMIFHSDCSDDIKKNIKIKKKCWKRWFIYICLLVIIKVNIPLWSRHELTKFVLLYCKLNNKTVKYEELSKMTMDLSFLNIFFSSLTNKTFTGLDYI
jgi:hypothetical protein